MIDLIEFGKEKGAEVRFIEYMDVGGATLWSMEEVVSRREMLEALESQYGPIQQLSENGAAPAQRYATPDGTAFGLIASTTEPFCRTCDRSRITADGLWFLCLYAAQGIDLRTWSGRRDRGAEERSALNVRGPLYQIDDLRKDPHREMHTRGG